MIPTPEHIEQAIGLINYVTSPGRPWAASADATFESLALDNDDRIAIGIEIELQRGGAVRDGDLFSWRTVRDLATTLANLPKVKTA